MTQAQAFLGYDESGQLALYISAFPLNPWGKRLEKGLPMPEILHQFHQEPHNRAEIALETLRSANAYLRGEEAGAGGSGLVFGQKPPKKQRKS